MITITAYYVVDGRKKYITHKTIDNDLKILTIMNQIGEDIINRISLGQFEDLPNNFDNTIQSVIGDRNNRYLFIGVPSNQYFCIMCHLLDNDNNPHDTIMFRGCAIDVNDNVSIRIGNNMISFKLPRTFYDIFDRVEEMFENWQSCQFIAAKDYFVPVFHYDDDQRIHFDRGIGVYSNHISDILEHCRNRLEHIKERDGFVGADCEVYKPSGAGYEPIVTGFIRNMRRNMAHIEYIPMYTTTDGVRIYDGFPIIKKAAGRFIVTYDYNKILQRHVVDNEFKEDYMTDMNSSMREACETICEKLASYG